MERNKKLHQKLQQWTEELRKSKAKGGDIYHPGLGMDGGYCMPADNDKKADKACTGCGQIGAGHLRPWSKKCPNYNDYLSKKEGKKIATGDKAATIEDQMAQDASEQELLDEIGFDEANCEFANTVEQDDMSTDDSDSDVVYDNVI